MIPNILTTVRLFLVPLFAYLMLGTQNLYAAAMVLVLSGLTDIVDGYIARRYNMISNFGKVYDPFVDKLMQITAVICLVLREVIPIWLLLLVVIKEVTMIISGAVLYFRKIVVSSNWYGKAATVVFYAGIITMIIWKQMPVIWAKVICAIIIFAMLGAAIGYFVDIIRNYDKKRV